MHIAALRTAVGFARANIVLSRAPANRLDPLRSPSVERRRQLRQAHQVPNLGVVNG